MRDSKKDKWLTTFGDLMALLFALFVLLISFSEINPETFEKHAAKMSSAFNQEVPKFKSKIKDAKFEINDEDTFADKADNYILDVNKTIIEKFVSNIIHKDKNLKYSINDDEVKLILPSQYLFKSGSAVLKLSVYDLMLKITDIFAYAKGDVLFTGHTDDVSINTPEFPSNWHLSAARASALAQLVVTKGQIDSKKIKVIGLSSNFPISKVRSENRRVEISFKIKS